ncbi:MAG: hypothetical protein MUF25_20935 [Pirellulaceae bacterium]|nr:hypothetical protein [Pirellulaceae bacterium]
MLLADHSVGDFNGCHVGTSRHDVTPYGWARYLTFAARHLCYGRGK